MKREADNAKYQKKFKIWIEKVDKPTYRDFRKAVGLYNFIVFLFERLLCHILMLVAFQTPSDFLCV